MPCRLLLVDDSVTIRRVVELTFAGEDVQVVAVGNGREAMDRILTETPDIVLADVGLADPDGYQVAAFVKGHPQLSHLPVLLLTGAFQPIDQARAAECGCDGVLAKPFDLQSMIGAVRGLLARAPAQAAPEVVAHVAEAPAPPEPEAARPSDEADSTSSLDWWAALLEEREPPEGPAASNGNPAITANPAAALSLDDYFDLVDEVLLRVRHADGPGPATCRIPAFRPDNLH